MICFLIINPYTLGKRLHSYFKKNLHPDKPLLEGLIYMKITAFKFIRSVQQK